MTPTDYNYRQFTAGDLTMDDVTLLVEHFQRSRGLTADGKAGPRTLATLRPFRLAMPLPVLPDGRRPQITSQFHTRNPSRPNHNGVDLFYRWMPGDKPDFVGDHGAAGRNQDGSPKWVIPIGTAAVAAAAGRVSDAGPSKTGHRVWIDHDNGLRTGYFHLSSLSVMVGQRVEQGEAVGVVGDNPADGDARHLHFELSPVATYAPVDPEPYLP